MRMFVRLCLSVGVTAPACTCVCMHVCVCVSHNVPLVSQNFYDGIGLYLPPYAKDQHYHQRIWRAIFEVTNEVVNFCSRQGFLEVTQVHPPNGREHVRLCIIVTHTPLFDEAT